MTPSPAHMHVRDLEQGIHFYSKLFSVQPAHVEKDYARWELEDSQVQFSIAKHRSADTWRSTAPL